MPADTGGLSGDRQRSRELGKIDPDRLPGRGGVLLDSTVALPLLTGNSLARHAPRR